jgi:class 3 adenylate cyclase
MRALPTGTVTFVFTDIEGSTRLLRELGAEAYADALAEHRRLLRDVFDRHDGVEVDTQGDAFFYAFPTAPGALEAVRQAQQGLSAASVRVRMGVHTGTPYLTRRAMWVPTSTEPPGSLPAAMAARRSFRPQRPPSPVGTLCATSASID